MNNIKFACQLRRVVDEIEQFVRASVSTPGNDHGTFSFLEAWCKKLTEWAELAEDQNSPLTPRQRETIGSNLFRGMGSFTDVSFDTRKFGDRAKAANERLGKLVDELYSIFNE